MNLKLYCEIYDLQIYYFRHMNYSEEINQIRKQNKIKLSIPSISVVVNLRKLGWQRHVLKDIMTVKSLIIKKSEKLILSLYQQNPQKRVT